MMNLDRYGGDDSEAETTTTVARGGFTEPQRLCEATPAGQGESDWREEDDHSEARRLNKTNHSTVSN